jgi:hypothetical protein
MEEIILKSRVCLLGMKEIILTGCGGDYSQLKSCTLKIAKHCSVVCKQDDALLRQSTGSHSCQVKQKNMTAKVRVTAVINAFWSLVMVRYLAQSVNIVTI